jgi:tRNA pseudouridine38-40 synthase
MPIDTRGGGCEAARTIALILEYDGSLFHGWQSQNNALAIQDVVAGALARLDARAAASKLVGASRTDAGVHALGQVASFRTESAIPADKYSFALNTLLPDGITCARSWEAAPGFHARHSATGKTYSYRILNRAHPSALERGRAWHVPRPLDADAMREAASYLVGEHDFRAFMAAGSPVASTVRVVRSLEVAAGGMANGGIEAAADGMAHGGIVTIRVSGSGFLYNMVRIIVGTLVYVGTGKIRAGDVPAIIASHDRTRAGKTAPPQGLCLEKVHYG